MPDFRLETALRGNRMSMIYPLAPIVRRHQMFSAIVIAGLLTLSACQTPSQRIVTHENNLAAAGFTIHPANTPQRQAMLAQLPPHKFVKRITNDTVHYVYVDPKVCKCLYVGTQEAYGKYQLNKQSDARIKQLQSDLKDHQNAAEDDDFNEQVYENPAFDWEAWGPWGP
jgi:hypothetical protein